MVYAFSSIGSWCLPGWVLFGFYPMMKTYFPVSFCIRIMSRLAIVWQRCPVNSQRRTLGFLVRVLRSRGWFPNVVLSKIVKTDYSVDLAVLIALYPRPLS